MALGPDGYLYVAAGETGNSSLAQDKGSLGGKILLPAMDVPTVGRIAVFQDPQGAALGVFQPLRV